MGFVGDPAAQCRMPVGASRAALAGGGRSVSSGPGHRRLPEDPRMRPARLLLLALSLALPACATVEGAGRDSRRPGSWSPTARGRFGGRCEGRPGPARR